MAKYRIGISENLLGDKRYQCQIKRFGIWWNDESFSTKERMLDYARKLEKAGHIVFNYGTDIQADTKDKINCRL